MQKKSLFMKIQMFGLLVQDGEKINHEY